MKFEGLIFIISVQDSKNWRQRLMNFGQEIRRIIGWITLGVNPFILKNLSKNDIIGYI